MFSYQELILDDPRLASNRLLSRSRRQIQNKKPDLVLEEGILTKLVKLARTRKHNQNPNRPSSICSICSRSIESARRCRRWAAFEINGVPQESQPGSLQPYCEVLGSFLCSDCRLERSKRNDLLHLPVIFGLGDEQRDNCRAGISAAVRSRANDKATSPMRDGTVTRTNTPIDANWNFNLHTSTTPLRLQIEHLAALPYLLEKGKKQFHQFCYREMKKSQVSDAPKYDLKSTFSTGLSSSMAKFLVDVNPKKLLQLKKLKVPCNTPVEMTSVTENRKQHRIDVLELAHRLQSLYRELHQPSRLSGSVSGYGSVFSGHMTSLFDDGTLEQLFLETGESIDFENDQYSYRALATSPARLDIQDTKRIQENLIDCYGRFDGQNLIAHDREINEGDS